MPELKRGSRGNAVRVMKDRLKAHGFWGRWPITSGFGRVTEGQVKKFQAARGLAADGVVGPLTWRELQSQPMRADGERARAVKWALGKVGVVEHPAGSNKGPGKDGITAMQVAAIGFDGAPWCQCFASYSAQVGSKGRLRASWYGGYTVGCVDMARNGHRGLALIPIAQARPGDWIEFNFPGGESVDHVGVFLSYSPAQGTVTCVEANTSSGEAGSQSNGGGVFKRTRSLDLVGAVIRVPFKN